MTLKFSAKVVTLRVVYQLPLSLCDTKMPKLLVSWRALGF